VSEQETREERFLPQSRSTAREIFLAQNQEAVETFVTANPLKCFKLSLRISCRRDNSRISTRKRGTSLSIKLFFVAAEK
jgi:hypothetical protein